MMSVNNILAPKDGKPVAVPTQDMVLGSYYLTFERFENGVSQMTNDEFWPDDVDFALAGKTYDELTDEEKANVHLHIYRDEDEALMAYNEHVIGIHQPVWVRVTRELGGEKVQRATAWEQLDLPALKTLIESSFGRELLPDYFERTPLLRAYVSENYRAAVILVDTAEGVYLDKFAVLDDAQGEGLGRAVWNVMREETPQLFWRSRHNNQVNIFYYAESDGCIKQEKWKVFWYGLDGFEQIQRCVAHSETRRPTLVG